MRLSRLLSRSWLAVAGLLLLPAFARHPVHVSVTEIAENRAAGTLEITHKLFLDDLTDVIRKTNPAVRPSDPLRLSGPNAAPEAEAWVRSYVERHFRIRAGTQPLALRWVGMEADAEAMWVYQEAAVHVPQPFLQLECSLLMDLYPDQTAVVNYNTQNGTRSALLRRSNPSAVLQHP